MPEQIDYSQRYAIRSGRVIFANYAQRKKLINEGRLIGLQAYNPNQDGSIIRVIHEGETNTTPAELARYLAEINTTSSSSSSSSTTTATVPGPPLSLCVIPSDSALTIVFLEGSTGGSPITNYQYSTNGTTYTALSPAQTSSPLTISGLTNGTVYTIYLKAVNSVGTSTASSSITAAPIPSSFDPSNISGLNIWLDAQNTVKVVVTGGQVSAWNDSSSATNDFTASGGVITYDQPSNINSRPALNFTTTGTYLSKTFNITPGTNQLTLFMIVNQTGKGTGNSELFYTRSGPSSPGFAYFDLFNNTNSTGILSLNVGDETQVSTDVDIITTPSTIAIISVVISTTGTVYVNGATTSITNTARGPLSLDNALEWAISAGAFLGNIGEVITYPTGLADTDREKVEGYLAWKWGLQANLPDSNFWKITPPTSDTAPGAPTLTFILASNNSAYVYYTSGTGTPINYQYTTDNGITYTSSSPSDTVPPTLVPGLSNGSSSTVQLRAYNGGGYSSISNGLSITPSNTSAPSGWLVIDPTTYSGGSVISVGTYTPALSGTITGSVSVTTGTGISRNVFNFAGGRIGFPSFNFGNTFTISAWIYPNPQASLNAIIANGPTNPNTPGFKFTWNTYSMDGSSSYKLLFENGSGTDWFLPQTVNNVVNLQTWQYVTVVFDQSQNISVFLVNGIPVNVTNITTSPSVVVTGRTFNIGAYGNDGFPMKGQLGLLKVFNSCLTASQVLDDFNATKTAFGL